MGLLGYFLGSLNNLVIYSQSNQNHEDASIFSNTLFEFEVNFHPEGKCQSPQKTIGTLTKVLYTFCSNVVILAWTSVKLSCGQTYDRRPHGETQATTIHEGQNWPRVTNTSAWTIHLFNWPVRHLQLKKWIWVKIEWWQMHSDKGIFCILWNMYHILLFFRLFVFLLPHNAPFNSWIPYDIGSHQSIMHDI